MEKQVAELETSVEGLHPSGMCRGRWHHSEPPRASLHEPPEGSCPSWGHHCWCSEWVGGGTMETGSGWEDVARLPCPATVMGSDEY